MSTDESAVFLQVRLDSSRLPEKALLPLGEKTVIAHAMGSLRRVEVDQYLLLTDRKSAPRLASYAADSGFAVFAGHSRNVLRRFCDAARHAGVDTIIRATGDNPLVSAHLAGEALKLHRETGADYTAMTGSPVGTGVEVLSASALQDLERYSEDPYELEHVSPGLYRRPRRYLVITPPVDQEYHAPEIRVTLDTADDYQRLCRIFDRLYRGGPIDTRELVIQARHRFWNSA